MKNLKFVVVAILLSLAAATIGDATRREIYRVSPSHSQTVQNNPILDAVLPQARAWIHGGPGLPWEPIAYFGSSLVVDFDMVDTSTVTTSGGNLTQWRSKVGSAIATPVSTAPAYSTTARNGLPGINCTGAEYLTFTSAAMPVGADSTVVIIGHASTAGFFVAGGYGGGFGNADSRYIDISTTGAGSYIVGPGGAFVTNANADHVVIAQFIQATSLTPISVDGAVNPTGQKTVTLATNNQRGSICAAVDGGNKFQGTIQGLMVINRAITQLEQDKLSSYLAWRYGQQLNMPVSQPYYTAPPNTTATLSSSYMPGYSLVWQDNFASLSLRTGGYWTGTTTGYNSPNARGTWSPSGLNYMTNPQGFYGFGFDWFLNPVYNWQALDPTFPPFGMFNLTGQGLVISGSGGYPAVRAALPALAAGQPYLAGLLTTEQSAKIAAPFARRWLFTIQSTSCYDFPALWALGDHYNGNPAHTTAIEWDDIERFGCEAGAGYLNQVEQHTHALGIGGGVSFNAGQLVSGVTTTPVTELLTIVNATNTYFYVNGNLTATLANGTWDTTDPISAIINFSVGMSFEKYPGSFNGSMAANVVTVAAIAGGHIEVAPGQIISGVGITGSPAILAFGTGGTTGTGAGGTYAFSGGAQTVATEVMQLTPGLIQVPQMTVKSVQYLAPPENVSGQFPATPPVPTVTWNGCCTAGTIPVGTTNGTVVATLGGAPRFQFFDYNGATPSNLAVSGTNLVVSGALSVGAFQFYIRGCAPDNGTTCNGSLTDGTSGIAPILTATFN